MPFHNYSPKTAKSLFKSNPAPSILSTQSASRVTKSEIPSRRPSSVSKSIKEKLEQTRALLASINKEKYDTDLELSRMGEKDAARARLEAAQRAALDEELRIDALEEYKKQHTPQVIETLRSELEPQIRAELLAQFRKDLRAKVHAELRSEMVDEVREGIEKQLKEDDELRNTAIDELKEELRDGLVLELKEELYPQAMTELKEEYQFMAAEQVKGELAAAAAVDDLPNGYQGDLLDPALRAESEASDIVNASSELAVIAKRRYSDTFQGEDGDTRQKRIRMVNEGGETEPVTDSLPPYGTLAMFPEAEMRAIDDSLEEGEKADVEDDANTRGVQVTAFTPANAGTAVLPLLAVPDDVYAEGGDEMSQSDDAKEKHSKGDDGILKSEDVAVTDKISLPEVVQPGPDTKDTIVLPTSSPSENKKLTASQSKRAAPPPPPTTRLLRSAGRVPDPLPELQPSTPKTRRGGASKTSQQAIGEPPPEVHEDIADNKLEAEANGNLTEVNDVPMQDSSGLPELGNGDPEPESISSTAKRKSDISEHNEGSGRQKEEQEKPTSVDDILDEDINHIQPSLVVNEHLQFKSSSATSSFDEELSVMQDNQTGSPGNDEVEEEILDQSRVSTQAHSPEQDLLASPSTSSSSSESSLLASDSEQEYDGPEYTKGHFFPSDPEEDSDEDEIDEEEAGQSLGEQNTSDDGMETEPGYNDDDDDDDDDENADSDAEADAETDYAQQRQYLQMYRAVPESVSASIYSQAGASQNEPIELD